MKSKVAAIAFLLALTFSSSAQSDASDDAASIFTEFLTAFTNADVEGIVDLFSEDALFWGTGSQSLVQDTAGIREYFSGLSRRQPGQSVASALDYTVQALSENSVIISGMWQVAPAGDTAGTRLRVSMAMSLFDDKWRIVQFHNSRVPE